LGVAGIVTFAGGGLIAAGIAYPAYARSRGWPIGAAAGEALWLLWFAFGAFAFLAGMYAQWSWWGAIAAVPVGFALGFLATLIFGKNVQLIAYLGPILANLWYFHG